MNQLYISDVTGSYGCHDDTDKARAVEAAEAVLSGVDAVAAMGAYTAMINDAPHDAALAAKWHEAEIAANESFTEGWAKPGGVLVSLEAR